MLPLRSPEVEKEVLHAQRENRIIIPCFHRDVSKNEIKWNLSKLQGIEFDERYDLARKLYSKITKIQENSGKRQAGTTSETKEDSTYKGVSKNYPQPTTIKDKKKHSWINPKIVIPIIAAAIVASILVFTVVSTITAPPPETTTTASPPETTTTAPLSSVNKDNNKWEQFNEMASGKSGRKQMKGIIVQERYNSTINKR